MTAEPAGDLTGHPQRELAGIRQHHGGDTLTLTLCGDLVADAGPPLLDLLDAGLTSTLRHVVIDLAHVGFVDVAGLRVLLRARRRSAENNTVLTIRRPQPYVVWLLGVTGTAALLLAGADEDCGAERVVDAHAGGTRDERADARDKHADARDERADVRDERASDRELLADERERMLDERHRRVLAHQQWEDVREDLADEREASLERREPNQGGH